MQQYSIFQAPRFSFYSKNFYNDTANKGKGSGILYLFCLILLCVPLCLVSRYLHFVWFIDNSPAINEMVSKLPDMSLKQGSFSFNKPSPYKIEFENAVNPQEKTTITFDSSGKTTNNDDAKIVITDKTLLMDRQPEWLWANFPFEFDLPAAKFKDSVKTLIMWLSFLGLLAIPIIWLGHLIVALIYSLVGLIMAAVTGRQGLSFGIHFRLAIVAMTPSILMSTILTLVFCNPEYQWFLLLWAVITVPITLAYLFVAYSSITPAVNEQSSEV